MPNEINQKDNNTPFKHLDEKQPLKKTSGIWQNLSTYNKTLSYVGANPMRFSSYDEAEENGRLQAAIEHNILYPINIERVGVDNIIVDYNTFAVEIKNPTLENQTVVLNQNYHHLWSATFKGNDISIKKHNDLTMQVSIPKDTRGKLIFEFNSPKTLPYFLVSLMGYLIMLAYGFKSDG